MWKQLCLGMFVVGLALAYMSDSTAVPQEHDPATVTSWRHLAFTDEGMSADNIASQINQLGSEGWQLVDVEGFPLAASKGTKTVYYFKKPG